MMQNVNWILLPFLHVMIVPLPKIKWRKIGLDISLRKKGYKCDFVYIPKIFFFLPSSSTMLSQQVVAQYMLTM